MIINLQGYFSDFGGCYYYRMAFPLNTIHERLRNKFEVLATYKLEAPTLRKAHIAIFQRVTTEEVLMFLKAARRTGVKIVVDIDDDLLNIPPWNPAAAYWGPKEKGIYIEALKTAHALFASTPYIKGEYKQYNDNIAVLPNCVDPFYFNDTYRLYNNRKFVIGYHGSNTHYEDMRVIEGALAHFRKNPEYVQKTFGYKYKGMKLTVPVVFESFYSVLSAMDYDVGICPLARHTFNKAKSNIKWMEYSMIGTPTVASPYGPYNCIRDGVDGILADTPEDWIKAIERLKEDPELGKELVKAAQKRISTNYNIEINFHSWVENVQRVLDKVPVEDHKFNEEESNALQHYKQKLAG